MGPPRIRKAPVYRWTVSDHRMGVSRKGEAPSVARAQADVTQELRRVGRGLNGVQATIFRPSGGGWFARQGRGDVGFTWEEWEPLDV